MQDDLPKNPRQQKAFRRLNVASPSASFHEVLVVARSRNLEAICKNFIDRLAKTNPYDALLCNLMFVSGLQLSEALAFKPHDSIRHDGLHISKGTMDGRTRFIPNAKSPHLAQRQRLVYECWLRQTSNSTQRNLFLEGLSIERRACRFQRVLAFHRQLSGLSITDHHLRIAYARMMFEDCIGYSHPTKGGYSFPSTEEHSLLVKASIQLVMRAMGH